MVIFDNRVKNEKPLCACTKVVSLFYYPPHNEDKSEVSSRYPNGVAGLRECKARSNPYVIIIKKRTSKMSA